MSVRQLNASDTLSAGGILRRIFFESIASSPTEISSTSSVLPLSNSDYVSVETCIKYIQSHIPSTIPNEAINEFRNLLKESAQNGRINWKMYKSVAQKWFASLDLQYQDGNNNTSESNNDDTVSNPDGSAIENMTDIFDGGSKSTDSVEWSTVPTNRMDNDITNESDSSGISIKSPGGVDNTVETELRQRIHRLGEDNVWLRDELERAEDLSTTYQQKFSTLRQRLDQISNKCNQLERENEEQKEMIINLEEAEKRYVILLEKAEKERKSCIDKLELHKQLIPNLNEKIDKLKEEKKYFIKELNSCRKKLNETEVMCDILQEKNDELSEQKGNLEEYHERILQDLLERTDDLKNENVKLHSRMSSGHPSIELSFTSSAICLNSSLESLPNDEYKNPTQNSLYDELKASGFSVDKTQTNSKIFELEEELERYNEEINNAINKLDEIIRQLGHKSQLNDRKRLSDASEYQTRYILILLDKITLLSDAVTETFRKPSTNDLSVQVSADLLTNQESSQLDISKFEDCLNTPINRRDPASGDSYNVFFTIGPTLNEKQDDDDDEILPKNIYTCTDRLNRRRWGRKFNSIVVDTPSGDAPINDTLSSSVHSSSESESKIIPRSAMSIDNNISRVNDAILSEETHKEINFRDTSLSERLSLSPICGIPNMTEKSVPKRKKSVYLRPYDVEKVFNTPLGINERIISSTPGLDDSETSSQIYFASTDYRTTKNFSDSSDSFPVSKLQSFIEEDTSIRDNSNSNEQSVFIAPPKLNLITENKIKDLNDTCPVQQDSMSPVITNDSATATAQSNMEILTNIHSDKDESMQSSPLLCIDNINNNFNGDSRLNNFSKPINVTWTLQSDVNSVSQRVSDDCSERAASKNRVVESTSVTAEMSSGDDSSDLSDSDAITNCIVTNGKFNDKNKFIKNKSVTLGIDQSNPDNSVHVISGSSEKNLSTTSTSSNAKTLVNKASNKHEIVAAMKRSRSESECLAGYGREGYHRISRIETPKTNGNSEKFQLMVFPSLPDVRLQQAGIANLSDRDDLEVNNLAEEDLARKFTAFSMGLCIDRLTLPCRRALSIRQRDQIERNFVREVTIMQQNIQDLAPLCFDSETIERIERASNQVDVIAQCAHEISCTAETLGAIQQEYRISRAINLADKYLRVLRSKCEKLVIDLAETKRILMEHNIIIDEHTGECSEEFTTLRYRGLPANNRTMTAKRRASIATIFRPIMTGYDAVKDGIRQRNSVSGRVTIRRPSFSADSQRWETEKLNRTESSNSVGELREIFEQAESRRASREENNNVMRLPINISECEESESKLIERPLSHNKEETAVGSMMNLELQPTSRRISRLILGPGNYVISWRLMICIIISFFIGFYVKDAVSSGPCIGTPFKWFSIEEILEHHVEVKNTAPRPI